eukprot:6379633-Ditylum_brightwellii.AAC.1
MSRKTSDILTLASKDSTKWKYARIQKAYERYLSDENLNPIEQNMIVNFITFVEEKHQLDLYGPSIVSLGVGHTNMRKFQY